MFVKRLIAILTLSMAISVQGQIDFAIEEYAENAADAAQSSALNDYLAEIADNPININDTTSLMALPFLTPFHYQALRNYIILYGQLTHIGELKYVPGFDSTTILMIEPFITVKPYTTLQKFDIRRIRHTITTGIGGTIEQAKGYEEHIYKGDNTHALFTYKANYDNKIEFRLSADKDPGEAWGKENYWAAHVMVKDVGRMERLIVGQYSLQFGQGLTLWTGIAPFRLIGQSGCRNNSGIKAASAFYESNYLNGVATSVQTWQGGSIMAFASKVDGESLYGSRIEHRTNHLIAGMTFYRNTIDDSIAPREYIYNRLYFRGKELTITGIDAVYNYGRLTAYGEASLSVGNSAAFVAGATWVAGGNTMIDISCHHYAKTYYNQHAQPIYYGEPRNENGLNIGIRTQLPLVLKLAMSGRIYNKPLLRYGAYQPSDGIENKTEVSRDISRYWQLSLRHSYREQLRNIPNQNTTEYVSERTKRQQLQADAVWRSKPWSWRTRMVYSMFDAETSDNTHGWLASSEIRYEKDKLQLTAKGLWFNVDGYYARIYQNESSPQYAWSIPAFNGKGGRAMLMLRYDISKHWNVCAKYAVTIYADRESLGSGAATINANHVQTWHLQFRLKL